MRHPIAAYLVSYAQMIRQRLVAEEHARRTGRLPIEILTPEHLAQWARLAYGMRGPN